MKNLIFLFLLFTAFQLQASDCDGVACHSTGQNTLPTFAKNNLGEILLAASSSKGKDKFPGIKGVDDRELIANPINDERFKYYRVGRLKVNKDAHNDSTCSATIVGKKFLLTAAHCFYNYKEGKFDVENAKFYLHASNDVTPVEGVSVKKVFLHKDIVEKEDLLIANVPKELIGKDFALVELTTPLGEDQGWNGFGNFDDLNLAHVRTAGYPGDKENYMVYQNCAAMSDSKIKDIYKINCDVYPGQSGSSIMTTLEKDGKPIKRIIGIVSSAATGEVNYATRFTEETFNMLVDNYQGKENADTHVMYLNY